MFLPGQIKRNRFIVLKDGRKMFVDDVDFKGNNNPFGHFAIHVVPERGSTEGEWVTGEQVVKVVSDPVQRPDVVDMGPLAYNRPTKQKTMNEKRVKRITIKEAEQYIQRLLKEDTQVAQTIIQQMGGAGKLRMMLGVKQFTAYPNGVGFAWPNPRRAQGGNYCKITLTPRDTYNVEFLNVSKMAIKPINTYRDVYFDQLIDIFEKQTGWYLRLKEAGLDPQARSAKPVKMVTCKLCQGTGSMPNGKKCDHCNGKGTHPELRKDVDEYTRYSGDPFWLTAKYGSCKQCGANLQGKRAFFYPKGKVAYCEKCGEKHSNEFDAAASDEDAYNRQYEKFEPSKARGRWMPTKVTKPPKKGKGASYNRQQFKKGDH